MYFHRFYPIFVFHQSYQIQAPKVDFHLIFFVTNCANRVFVSNRFCFVKIFIHCRSQMSVMGLVVFPLVCTHVSRPTSQKLDVHKNSLLSGESLWWRKTHVEKWKETSKKVHTLKGHRKWLSSSMFYNCHKFVQLHTSKYTLFYLHYYYS